MDPKENAWRDNFTEVGIMQKENRNTEHATQENEPRMERVKAENEENTFEDRISSESWHFGGNTGMLMRDGTSVAITLNDSDVINLWYTARTTKKLPTDTDLARFLLSLYLQSNSGERRPEDQRDTGLCTNCGNTLTLTCLHCQSPQAPPLQEPDRQAPPFKDPDRQAPPFKGRKRQAPPTEENQETSRPISRLRSSGVGRRTKVTSKPSKKRKQDFPVRLKRYTSAASASFEENKEDETGKSPIEEKETCSTRYGRKVQRRKIIENTAKEWTPRKKASKVEFKVKVRPEPETRDYVTEGYSLEDFIAGKIQLPDNYQLEVSENGENDELFTHYTCFICYSVFDYKSKEQFVAHSESCSVQPGEDAAAGEASKTSDSAVDLSRFDEQSMQILDDAKDKFVFCCTKCERVFVSKNEQKLHTLTHMCTSNENGAYTCNFCSATMKWHQFCYRHIALPKEEDAVCMTCGLSFDAQCQIQPHMKHHKEEKKGKCQECGESFHNMSNRNIKKHLKTHRDKYDIRDMRVPCAVCGEMIVRRRMPVHLASHRTDRPFSCSVCGAGFKLKNTLRCHEKTHEENKLQCEVCGKKYTLPCQLRAHMKFHEGFFFDCKICGKKLRSKSYLEKHVQRIHQKLKPFPCTFCSKSFADKHSLRSHTATHTDEKPWQCEYCPSKFVKHHTWQNHMRIHTGEKPYKCEDCEMTFRHFRTMLSHRRTSHSDITFPCVACKMDFLTRSQLAYHNARQHGAERPTKRQSKGYWDDSVPFQLEALLPRGKGNQSEEPSPNDKSKAQSEEPTTHFNSKDQIEEPGQNYNSRDQFEDPRPHLNSQDQFEDSVPHYNSKDQFGDSVPRYNSKNQFGDPRPHYTSSSKDQFNVPHLNKSNQFQDLRPHYNSKGQFGDPRLHFNSKDQFGNPRPLGNDEEQFEESVPLFFHGSMSHGSN